MQPDIQELPDADHGEAVDEGCAAPHHGNLVHQLGRELQAEVEQGRTQAYR